MTQILKILDVDDGKWKQDVFSVFWKLSFNGIFVKLSIEWDPPVWLVPSHNVSLQKSVWHSHSNSFFSLSLLLHFFFFYPELSLLTNPSLLLHKPPPPNQSSPSRATTRSGLRFFSLFFLPLPDRFLSQAFFLSLIPFSRSSPTWATITSHHEISSSSA